MAEKRLSEELENCFRGNCVDCAYYEPETKLTCKGLLQKTYDLVKRYEEMNIYKSNKCNGCIHEYSPVDCPCCEQCETNKQNLKKREEKEEQRK